MIKALKSRYGLLSILCLLLFYNSCQTEEQPAFESCSGGDTVTALVLPTNGELRCPKLAETSLPISRMVWSADRKKLWGNFDGLKPEHVYYLRLPNTYWLSH